MTSSLKQSLCVMGLFAAATIATPVMAQMHEGGGNHHNIPSATKAQLDAACKSFAKGIQMDPGIAALVFGHKEIPDYNPSHMKNMIKQSCNLPESTWTLNPKLGLEKLDGDALEKAGNKACEDIHNLVHSNPGFSAIVHKNDITDQSFHYACMGAPEPKAP